MKKTRQGGNRYKTKRMWGRAVIGTGGKTGNK